MYVHPSTGSYFPIRRNLVCRYATGMTVCHMTQSKVKVKVKRSYKIEILAFPKCASSRLFAIHAVYILDPGTGSLTATIVVVDLATCF